MRRFLRRGGLLKGACALVYLYLYLPMAVMMAFSFNSAKRNVVWTGFTLEWYGRLAENAPLWSALWTSLKLGLVVTGVTSVLATLASYALARHRPFRGRAAYAALLNLPMMMPEVVFGVGLLAVLVRARIPLSFWTLVLAHVVFCLPYAAGSIRARLTALSSQSLEEAAMDLGATEWQAFLRVTLPVAWPAIAAGALLAFTVSFEDYVTSFFVGGGGVVTLPIYIYSMMKFGITPELNALATLIVLSTLGVFGAWRLLGGGSGGDAPAGG